MRDTHTLLINKQSMMEHNIKDPRPNFDQFINYTDVDDMIKQVIKPELNEIPNLGRALREQNKKLATLHTITKQLQNDVKNFNAKQREL